MPTPADPRTAAERLIDALPTPLPRDEARCADAVQAALLDSELLDRGDLGNSPAVAAAARDGLTSLAHLLDTLTGGHGAGQLLLLLLAEHAAFTPHPAPDGFQLGARRAATALLNLALWHTDDPLRLLGAALQVHAEEARDAEDHTPAIRAAESVTVTPGRAPDSGELHLTVQPFEVGALSVCGRWLDQRAEDTAGGPVPPACDGCFGRAPLDPAPVFTAAEHDAWTAYLAAHHREEA